MQVHACSLNDDADTGTQSNLPYVFKPVCSAQHWVWFDLLMLVLPQQQLRSKAER